MIRKKRPRTCVGCMQESPKRELVRIVRKTDNTAEYDPSGRAPGRGAYVCLNADCIQLAKKKNALARALKATVLVGVYEQLLELCSVSSEKGNCDE